ncbi:MAG TPA: hypothetical protein VFQ61_05930, partial [Polyangiaceae bacterium]|nr:hypothetical protein [Polyangiaceae bacterium]
YAVLGAGVIAGAGAAVGLKPSSERLGAVVLCCDFVVGLAFAALGQARQGWGAGALLFAMGGALGLTMVAGTTWFQSRTPGALMGRVMSFVMFAIFGLTPISTFVAGYLLRSYSVGVVTAVAGVTLSCVAAIGLATPKVRRMGFPQLDRSTT